MTVPANIIAPMVAGSSNSNPLTLTITQPANGSTIPNNSTAEAIQGNATTTAGGATISTIQYNIDGGSWNNISFSAGSNVNYSGGNVGQVGVGTHVCNVRATDSAGNTAAVSTTYSILNVSNPSYSWTPPYTYQGFNNFLTINNAAKNATVAYQQNIYDRSGNLIISDPLVTLGTTDGSGNFSFTGTANWPSLGYQSASVLYVGGTPVQTFNFYNTSGSPSIVYGPTHAPTGTAINLVINSEQGSAPVWQQVTYSPSNRTASNAIGTTSSIGNLGYSYNLSWGTDTTAVIAVHIGLNSPNGPTVGTFSFTST